jgi:general stress protein YciG
MIQSLKIYKDERRVNKMIDYSKVLLADGTILIPHENHENHAVLGDETTGLPVDAVASATGPTLSQQIPAKLKRGFALLSPERRKEISAMGGKKSHEIGTGHQWNTEAAREAGRKGGAARGQQKNRGPRIPVILTEQQAIEQEVFAEKD